MNNIFANPILPFNPHLNLRNDPMNPGGGRSRTLISTRNLPYATMRLRGR